MRAGDDGVDGLHVHGKVQRDVKRVAVVAILWKFAHACFELHQEHISGKLLEQRSALN